MKVKVAENYELDMQDVVKDSLRFWKATRINGASSSMADGNGVSFDIVRAFDEISKLTKERFQH